MLKTVNKLKEPTQEGRHRPLSPAPAAPPAATAAATADESRPYQVVAGRIRELIRAEGIQPGERLPSERDLSTRLSVSRASLREALIALELSGVIDVRGGSGIYVRELQTADTAVAVAGPGPFEVLSARRLIEPELAALAARVGTDGAIDKILAAAVEMERHHVDKASCEQADRNFHLAIARATGNSALVGVIEYLWDQRGSLWQTLEELFQTEELRRDTLGDHRRIVQAIAERDPAAARHAMRAHLERVTRTLSRG
jgi:DNA-binding FadR family transcriptional regulator